MCDALWRLKSYRATLENQNTKSVKDQKLLNKHPTWQAKYGEVDIGSRLFERTPATEKRGVSCEEESSLLLQIPVFRSGATLAGSVRLDVKDASPRSQLFHAQLDHRIRDLGPFGCFPLANGFRASQASSSW